MILSDSLWIILYNFLILFCSFIHLVDIPIYKNRLYIIPSHILLLAVTWITAWPLANRGCLTPTPSHAGTTIPPMMSRYRSEV